MSSVTPTAGAAPRADSTPTTWVNAKTVTDILGIYPRKLTELVEQGLIARRHPAPGMKPRFRLEDALKLRTG